VTRVYRMEFSSDNRLLLPAGDEPFIRVWDVDSGTEIGRVGTLRPILAMSFTDQDRRVIAFVLCYELVLATRGPHERGMPTDRALTH